jgi:hypothetical protein
MTLAVARGTELTISTVVRRSYQLAGLMNAGQGTSDPTWLDKLALGQDLLQSMLFSLQAEGVFARQVVFYYLPLTAPTTPTEGTYIYPLPATVFDVLDVAMYIDASQTDVTQASGETPVLQKDRDTWQRMSNKNAQARPIIYYVDRTTFPIQVYVWPTPNEAGHIRFQTVQLPADSENGNATLDLERYWLDFVLWELAKRLAIANSLPSDKIALFGAESARSKQLAKAYSHQHTTNQMHVTQGPWGNRRFR